MTHRYTVTDVRGRFHAIGKQTGLNLALTEHRPGGSGTYFELLNNGHAVWSTKGARSAYDRLSAFYEGWEAAHIEDFRKAAESVIEWARTPGEHGGNPYLHEFVKLARKALGDE